MPRPESIENRWDILYQDYPEVYDAFSRVPYHPTSFSQLAQIIDLRGRTIADVGAGTGRSTFQLAPFASRVIGIEKEAAMLRVAQGSAAPAKGQWVTFLCSDALALPLAPASVDLVTGITLALYPQAQYRRFIEEGLRIAKEAVIYLGITPGWYGGDLHDRIDIGESFEPAVDHIFLHEYRFEWRDISSFQDYGTVDNMVSTYGFIFGRKTIDYIRQHQKTTIEWRFRLYWKKRPPEPGSGGRSAIQLSQAAAGAGTIPFKI